MRTCYRDSALRRSPISLQDHECLSQRKDDTIQSSNDGWVYRAYGRCNRSKYKGDDWNRELKNSPSAIPCSSGHSPRRVAIALAQAANAPILFTPVEIPVEAVEPVKAADEPVVMELTVMPIMVIVPTRHEVELAHELTPPPGQAELAARHPHFHGWRK